MKIFVAIGIAAVAVTYSLSTAVPVVIGDFPGLNELIAKSDAIVILRVDQHAGDVTPNPTLYTTHDCYVYQTFKGDIPTNKTIRLQLMDTRTELATPYSVHSTHLMFLTKKRTADEPTEFRTIEFKGANIRIPDLGNEKLPTGDTVAEQIKSLLRRTMEHNQKRLEREKTFLTEMAK